MRVSQLVARLQALQRAQGDVEVVCDYGEQELATDFVVGFDAEGPHVRLDLTGQESWE